MSCDFPLSASQLSELAEKFPTPFYLYDEKAIRENMRAFTKAFSIFPDFCEYFAVKALPNPYILKILASEGCGGDCSSLPELVLCEKSGIKGEKVMFTSNETPAAEYEFAYKNGNIINLDDITHIDFLEKTLGTLPELICFRYNPGPLKEGNALIGKPEEAKYGLTHDQIIEAYAECKKRGVKRFGLHTMVASNELNPEYFVDTAKLIFNLAVELKQKDGVRIEFVDLGGGIGIPYKPEQKKVDYDYVAKGIRKAYDEIIVPAGLDPLKICWECGRPITGPYGYLVTKAIHEKHIFQLYGTVVAYQIENPNKKVIGLFICTCSLSDTAKRFADFLGVQYKENASIGDYPLIKCNINRTTKERIYHLPFDQQYDRVVISPNSEECYAWTVQEAEDKGFRRAWRWHSQQGATS